MHSLSAKSLVQIKSDQTRQLTDYVDVIIMRVLVVPLYIEYNLNHNRLSSSKSISLH